MNNIVNKIKDNKFIILGGIVTFLLCSLVIGATYSYLSSSATNSSIITGTVASAGLTVTVEKKAPSSNKGLVPQLNSAIESAVVGTKGNCIDGNNNEVCQVYEITVTNTGGSVVNVDGILDLEVGNNSNLSWARIDSYVSNMKSKPTVLGGKYLHTSKNFVANDKITPGSPKKYYLVLWISETGGAQTDNGSFTGTITFKTSKLTPSVATLYKLGLDSSLKTETPDFSKTSCSSGCEENTVGIYKTKDDLGDSYYFRGDVTNNYVKFGKYAEDAYQIRNRTGKSTYSNSSACPSGNTCKKIASAGSDMYWRIVRINGDGTIRLIYDGTSAHLNGEVSIDRQIGESYFEIVLDKSIYAGYTYDEEDYTFSSIIKDTVDNWYKTYINNTEYESSVVDAIYCNDKSLDSDYSNTINDLNYGAYDRIVDKNGKGVILTCLRDEDKYTNSPYLSNGNAQLFYPVGLITADEMIMAGYNYNGDNTSLYLYTGSDYWSMTPSNFVNSSYSSRNNVTIFSASSYVTDFGSAKRAVRVVVSLKQTAIKSGSGTANDPFVV